MGRHSDCCKQTLRKGLWSPDEDEKLIRHIAKHGHGCWSSVPKHAGLQRCGKSCRLRWINYLRPDLKRGTFSLEEEELIIELQAALGNRWSKIAAHLPGRTDNEIKNLWNSCLKKKLRQRGNDPNFHKPPAEGDGGDEKSGAGSSDLRIPAIPTSASAKLAALHELTPSASAEDESIALTSKSSLAPTKEPILDQFLAGHGSMGYYFPFSLAPQYAMSSSQLLWSNQDSRNFDTNHELNSPPSLSSTILSTPMAPSPSFLGAGTAAILNSYSNNSDRSYGGCILTQSNGPCELSGFFPWSELTPEEDALVQIGGELDELKWSDYLHGRFPLSSTVQDQSQLPLYGDIQLGSQVAMNCLNNWHWNSQQQQQRSVIHGKDFLPVSLGYEQSGTS